MKRRIALFIGIVMILSISLMGCGGNNTTATNTDNSSKFDPSKHPVFVAMVLKNHPVHRIVQLGFVEEAKKLGYPVEIVGIENVDWPSYYASVEAAVAKGAKGALLWVDPPHTQFIKKIGDLGVKVVVPHFKFEQEKTPGLTANLSADSTEYGKAVAKAMAAKLKGKKGTIAITQNDSNTTENNASKAFTEQMKLEAPDIKVLPPAFEGPELTAAIAKIAAIIQKNTDLIGAFGTTGGSAASWAGAMDETGKKDLTVIGMDYTEQNVDLVKSGKIYGIVAQPLYDEAKMSMDLLDKSFRGEQFPWFTPLEAPIATLDGKDKENIAYYDDIIKRVKASFK